MAEAAPSSIPDAILSSVEQCLEDEANPLCKVPPSPVLAVTPTPDLMLCTVGTAEEVLACYRVNLVLRGKGILGSACIG